MKLLLDTHTALWLFNQHEHLSANVKALLLDENNSLHISIASVWEVAIKNSLGKLSDFRGGVQAFLSAIQRSHIELIPILSKHIQIIESLPFIHRDPFDRVLIATAQSNIMTILTADANIQKYDVKWQW
jgi:PIN domain nuclease of toxin-antitoxin system